MENVPCTMCGSSARELLFKASDVRYGVPGEFNLCRCSQCGLVAVSPRPEVSEIGAWYPAMTREHASDAVPNQFARGEARIVTELLPNAGAILDIGCAAGYFLAAMSELHWRCYGIEPSATAVEKASAIPGAQVKCGVLEEEDFPSTQFDAITFWSSLEHLHDPLTALKIAAKKIKPSGRLFIEVPNFGSLERRIFKDKWFHLDVPRHLHHFTPSTLKAMLGKAGFETVSVSFASGHDGIVNSLKLKKGVALNEGLTSSADSSSNGASEPEAVQRSLPSRLKGVAGAVITRTADRIGLGSQMIGVARLA